MPRPAITGKVQQVYVDAPNCYACVQIGPTPSNVEACPVFHTTGGQVDDDIHLAYKNSILAAALAALANGLPISVHFDNEGYIANLTITA
jgi:hypothetical protein